MRIIYQEAEKGSVHMGYSIFIIIALLFFIVAYKVGINKNICLINSIDKEDALKLKNKESVAKAFGFYYFFLGIVSSLCSYITYRYDIIGFGISASILSILFLVSVILAIKMYLSI